MNYITVRLDSSFIKPFLNQIESPLVIPMYDGFPSLDYRWFHGQFPCASPHKCKVGSLLYITGHRILEERCQHPSSVSISMVSSCGIFKAAAAAA